MYQNPGGYPQQTHPVQGVQWQGNQAQQQFMPTDQLAGPMKPNVCQAPPYIRSDFIRKVYSILTMQLLLTFAIALYMNAQLTPAWVADHILLYYICSYGTIAVMFSVSCCCREQTRIFPQNYAFLLLITAGIAGMAGFVSVLYTTNSVLLVLGVTAGVFLTLTAYACITKTDFTGLGVYLFAGLACLMMFGLFMSLWSYFTGTPVGSTVHLIYACLGVILFVFYIIYDTQMIVGGGHRQHQFSVDDYVFAALALYLDVINLFMMLLQIMGDRR